MVQRKKFDVIVRFQVDRYLRTKLPKPDASQFVVPARLPKPVIGSVVFDFLLRGLRTMCQKSTAHEKRRSRGESRKLRFGSNRTAPKIWQEGQHDLHSPPQPIDWREHTNKLQSKKKKKKKKKKRTHHWSSPRSKLAYKKPTSTRKLRKFPVTTGQGSKHRDWTASRWWPRWRSQSSSCQHHVITWRGLIPADHEYLDSVAWPCHDCEVAPVWHHDVTMLARASFSAVCLTVFPFEFRPRTFTIGFYGKNSIISELMILECSFPLKEGRKSVPALF